MEISLVSTGRMATLRPIGYKSHYSIGTMNMCDTVQSIGGRIGGGISLNCPRTGILYFSRYFSRSMVVPMRMVFNFQNKNHRLLMWARINTSIANNKYQRIKINRCQGICHQEGDGANCEKFFAIFYRRAKSIIFIISTKFLYLQICTLVPRI